MLDKLRNVTIVVTNIKTGENYLGRSYPDDDYDNNNKIELYNIPVYKVLILGTNQNGNPVRKEWKALRFMPYWNDPNDLDQESKTRGWVNAGKHRVERKAVTYYNPNYGTHNRYSPYRGAIQIDKSFLIHAGPQNLADTAWGSAGCVEIIGSFNDFKDQVKNLSGSTNADHHNVIQELVKKRKLFVQVDYAKPPDIKSNFEREEVISP